MEGRFGWFIRRQGPWGVNIFHDMSRVQELTTFTTVLDVGANVGQTASTFLKEFPHATIHAFEPVAITYAELCRNVVDDRFHAYRLAMGSAAGEQAMYIADDSGLSEMNTIGKPHPLLGKETVRSETVLVDTLDGWCATNGITRIGLLKIDAEGHDLEALKGADGLLGEARVDFVLCEAGVDPKNELHVPLGQIIAYMARWSYGVFGIYDQVILDHVARPMVRRVNVLFIKD